MKKDKDKIGLVESPKSTAIRFSPYLVSVEESLHVNEKKPLLERLDRKHIQEGQLSGEGFIEIDLVGCDALELVGGSEHDVMVHHGWDRVRSGLNAVIDKNEKRVDKRYQASSVKIWIKPAAFLGYKELKRACLLDFSISGIGLVCSKKFAIDKKVVLKIEFSGGPTFNMEGVVVRNEASQLAATGFFNGIVLSEPDQLYKDQVLKEGLRRKVK